MGKITASTAVGEGLGECFVLPINPHNQHFMRWSENKLVSSGVFKIIEHQIHNLQTNSICEFFIDMQTPFVSLYYFSWFFLFLLLETFKAKT